MYDDDFEHGRHSRSAAYDDDGERRRVPGKQTLVEAEHQGTHDVPAAPGKRTLVESTSDFAIARAPAGPAPMPGSVPPAVASALSRALGEPLSDPDKWRKQLGVDVSHARIVKNEGAAEAATALGARAFTVGHRVFFAGGNDETTDGGKLLAHELTHVAQQRGGIAPTSWEKTPMVGYDDHREVQARAQAAATSGGSEVAIARDAEPDINGDAYRAKFSKQIGDGVLAYLQANDLPTGSRFVTFLGPVAGASTLIGGQGGAALDATLDAWVGRDKVAAAIGHARPKGTVEVTDGKSTWIDDKMNEGPGRWFPDVATEIGALLHAALRVSLDRVVPRFQSAAVAVGIAAEEKTQSNLIEAPRPKPSDVVASSQLDSVVIDNLIKYAQFDYAGYRRTYPKEKGQLGVLRAVELTVEAPSDGVLYARVSTPVDPSREEVANQLFGSPTMAGEISVVAPPLFGFASGLKLKQPYADKLRALGVNLHVSVVDPVAAAASGPLADQIAKNQGQKEPTKLATKTGVLACIGESLEILPTIEKSGTAFGMGKNPTVSSLAPLRKQLTDRRAKIATMGEEDALSWAGQAEAQQRILSQVSFSFDRHASRLADLTKMSKDAAAKLGGFELPDYVRDAMNRVAMRYADVCLMSSMVGSADEKLVEVEDEAGALPVTFLEGALVSIQRSLDNARDPKHDAGEHASYDVGGMQKREVVLKQRLAALRERIKTDPEGATKDLQEISKLVEDLQTETELVANLDHIDAAWQALDKGISFWWTGLWTQHKASNLKDRGDALHKRWKAIFSQWKSGDPKKQEQAKKDLDTLRKDPELGKWLGEVQSVLKDARIERLIAEFVVVIAITVVTAGVGDLVAAGATGWGLSAGGTAVLAGGAEAATFTLLNQIFLDGDHSFGHIAYEFGTNWAMFGVMRRFQAFAEVAELTKAQTVTTQTLILAASTYAKADLDKYIKEGRHLNGDEVKQIALQGMAMAIAMHAVAPAMKPLWQELEGSAYKFGTELRANNRLRDTLAVKAEQLKGTKSYTEATEYVTQEAQWLKQRIAVLDQIEAQAKAEAKPGAKKPADGGIAAKIKMKPEELSALRADLNAKLQTITDGSLPLLALEPKGKGLFVCPREHIVQVVESLGEVVKKTVDPTTTVATYEVKVKDIGETVKVMEKIDPATDWVAHLKQELTTDARTKLEADTKGWTAQQIHDHFHGSTEEALESLGTTRAKPAQKDTIDMFTVDPPADANAKWQYKDDPSHWKPERRALHEKLLAKAKQDALAFALAAPKGEPTLYAMRGNTAAGKTRAVASNVPELQGTMKQTANNHFRAVNPDAFKPALMTEAGQNLTSSQVHAESSMLADRFQAELLDLKVEGKPASMLIDKRLVAVGDVQAYADLAKATGRKFVLYDVEAPLEASLAGVLERQPGGTDPLPGYEVVADGFRKIHNNRGAVIDLFINDRTLGTYELFGAKPTGERVPVATVKDGNLTRHDPDLFAEAVAGPDQTPELVGRKRITETAIGEFTAEIQGPRRTMVQNLLRKYLGWTWRDALDAHAKERPPMTKRKGSPEPQEDPSEDE